MPTKGILILGSAGFVGTSLLNRLGNTNHRIFSISTHAQPKGSFPNVNTFVCSLDNHKVLREVLPQCNIVFYFASHSTPGFSAHKSSIEANANLLPCLRFLELLEEYKDTLLVYLSSGGAVYGNGSSDLNSENLALKPLSYYGAGKAAIEKFLLAYQSQTGNKILILRPSNLYGPGQKIKEGFGIIPTTFKKIVEGTPVSIWGNGQAVRDYLHIDDFLNLCEIIIEKRTIPTYRRRIYNVGSGEGISLNHLLRLIENVTGGKVQKEYRNQRGVDVDHNVLDCLRIKDDYDWVVESDLQRGILQTWEWFKKEYS